MNLHESLAEHVASILLLLPGFAAGSYVAAAAAAGTGSSPYDADTTDVRYDQLHSTASSSSTTRVVGTGGRPETTNGLRSVAGSHRLPSALSTDEDQSYFRLAVANIFNWLRATPGSLAMDHVSGSRDNLRSLQYDSGSTAAERRDVMTKLEDVPTMLLVRSKRALRTIGATSMYGNSSLGARHRHQTRGPDDDDDDAFNLTDYVSDTIREAVDSARGQHSDRTSLGQPATAIENVDGMTSSSPSSLVDATGPAQTAAATSGPSTPFPGYINLNNISFDEANLSGLFSDRYFGNLTARCLDWSTNGSCLYANGTMVNVSDVSDADADVIPPPIRLWTLFLLIFPLFTVFGNILVVMSVYKERSLRTVTNYFIVSLAIADIMVAVLVMPLAVYVEVVNQHWTLGDALCDTWVAFDVMCCTASILNLTAISVDRFIAVTQPLKYARHKNSNRVWVMLVLTWIVSVAISSPIALGMNYTERRDPNMCVFYNSDFLIYSSMGSFYIPCLIMILLYWRIFRAIRMRAKKTAAAKRAAKAPQGGGTGAHNSLGVIENRAPPGGARTTSDASATEDSCHRELLPSGNSVGGAGGGGGRRSVARIPIAEETSFTNYNVKLNATTTSTATDNSADDDGGGGGQLPFPVSDDDDDVGAHVIPNDKSTDAATSDDNVTPTSTSANHRHVDADVGYAPPARVVVETRTSGAGAVTSHHVTRKTLLSPPPRRPVMNPGVGVKAYTPGRKLKTNDSPKKTVTKFNFHLHRAHSRKKKDAKSCSSRRERKATKTLAIVLGVFLLCWVPFFTVNIMNAICIRFELYDRPECNIDGMLFSFFVWLGYINSFLNPVIYTIFNVEFRRAFKKLLFQPCK